MLSPEEIKGYWKKRAELNGERAVGYNNKSLSVQNKEYDRKHGFVLASIEGLNNLRVLEYGCGTGRWSRFFNKYTGLDITEEFIEIAKRKNPSGKFEKIEDFAVPQKYKGTYDVFFTANVLQHNPPGVVLQILESVKETKGERLTLVFYENTEGFVSSTTSSRKETQYLEMVKKVFTVEKVRYASHDVHGERHSVMRFYVK